MTEAPNQIEQASRYTAFRSILFDESQTNMQSDRQDTAEFFADLHLDQIVATITAGRDEYNLDSFFHMPLRDSRAVHYRQDVFRDLENESLRECIRSFSNEMRTMRMFLSRAEKSYYKLQKQRWFLDAVEMYCGAARRLGNFLANADLHARGLLDLCDFLTNYLASDDFISLIGETEKLKTALSTITYSLHIDGKCIEVGRHNSEPDYGADVLGTFEKFRQGAVKAYDFNVRTTPEMNPIEAAVLELVGRLYPEIFSELDAYCIRHNQYVDATIATFDREVQFYMAWIEHVDGLKRGGLPFCYPGVNSRSKDVKGCEVFDLALANELIRENRRVVTNDFYLTSPERILVVTGPNQGGKTTFARTFGQLHYLASLGCPVPGTEARLFLFDRLFTHFEREEDIQNLSGKLEDDLRRIRRILEAATGNSILIMNESFLSTTLDDALFLSKQIMQRVIEREMLCVCVTFLDELASLTQNTVSMASTVSPADPAQRMFKIVRKPADGLAYAMAIAEKHQLTYEKVKQRISENTQRRSAS